MKKLRTLLAFLLGWMLIPLSIYCNPIEDIAERLPSFIGTVPGINGEFESIESMPGQGGSFINAVYLVRTTKGEECVLKIENKNWEKQKTLNEVRSIQFLGSHSQIPVPTIYYFAEDAYHSPLSTEFILMKRIQGTPLNLVIESIYSDKQVYLHILDQLASILANLRGFEFKELGNFDGSDALRIGGIVDFSHYTMQKPCSSFSEYVIHSLRYYLQEMEKLEGSNHPDSVYFRECIPTLKKWVQIGDFSCFDCAKQKFVYSHQDFVMKNILVQDGTVTGILDWEWSGAAMPEVESMTGCDFLFTDEDRILFNHLLEQKGVSHFFSPPPYERALFYELIGRLYTLVACHEWTEGKLEHTAKFLHQKLEQRKIRSDPLFNRADYLKAQSLELEKTINVFEGLILK